MLAEPRRSGSRQVRLAGQTEETYTPEADLAAIRKACQGLAQSEAQVQEFDGIIVAAGQAAAARKLRKSRQLAISSVTALPGALSTSAMPHRVSRRRTSQRRASPTAPARFLQHCWLSRGAAGAVRSGWPVRLKKPILPKPI